MFGQNGSDEPTSEITMLISRVPIIEITFAINNGNFF